MRHKVFSLRLLGASYAKGQEMGWFQHGSTLLVFLPPGYEILKGVAIGNRIQMGLAVFKPVSTHLQLSNFHELSHWKTKYVDLKNQTPC